MNKTPQDPASIGQSKQRPLWNNAITLLGLFLAVMAVILLLTFALFSLVVGAANPYVDIIGYLILPSLLIFALLIVPFGILFKSWRLRRHDPETHLAFRFPRIDLNDPVQRKVAKFFLLGMLVMLPVVGVSAYQGYHYTDSPSFCGYACHAVMEPEATTYETSAHARVACAECHIGEGASWFVKAKLSGTRQVFATLMETYARPISPAIQHLRPARETCERCHWPKKFFGAQLREIPHFASDERNTRRDVTMLVKTGGGDEATGRAEGIHLHMALSSNIEYIATDDVLQVIPWVKMIDDTGTELIYRSDGRPTTDPLPDGQRRRLDCMDCHNRPAHEFRSPQESVNLFLSTGRIDTTLPYVKREAVKALVQAYPDVATAEAQIGRALAEFYEENYPDLAQARRASINQAIDQVRQIYRQSFFPGMKVDWRTYSDNIGHMIFRGCFRCHAGKHFNQFGDPISHDCHVCHTFLNPQETGAGQTNLVEGEFNHPYDLEGSHATLRCDQCHTGGAAPVTSCEGCHDKAQAFRAGTLAAFAPFGIEPEPMYDVVDCESCHDLSEPTTLAVIDDACMACHEDEPEKYDGQLASWKKEVDDLLGKAKARADEDGQGLIRALREAGPLHNVPAATRILQAVLSGNAEVSATPGPATRD